MTNLQDSKTMYDLAEKIALDDFDRLEGHHEFSDTYKHKKKLFLEEIKEKSEQPKAKPKKRRLLIAAASILIAIPTTALGAVKAYEMVVQKQNYELDISVTKPDKNNEDKYASENNENKWYKLQLNYLPENMEEVPNTGGVKFSYKDNFAQGGFSFALMEIERDSEFQSLYVTDHEVKEINGRKAVIINRDSTKEVYILFENEGIMIESVVMSDVDEDVMMKVLENISLVPTTEENASPIAYVNHEENPERKVIPLNKDSDRIFNVGEGVPVTIETAVKESNGSYRVDSLKYTVDKVEVFGSIKDLDQEDFYEVGLNHLNRNNAIAQDKTLLSYKRDLYKLGNGKDSLNELLESQSVNVKFVYLTTSVTNTSKHATEEIYMHPSLQVLKSEGNTWTYATDVPDPEISENSIMSGEVDYLKPHGNGKSYYNIGTIQPGETKKINLGYFIDEDKLDSIFLDAFNYTGSDNLNAEDHSWIDIRQ